jgi:hypothetical protein
VNPRKIGFLQSRFLFNIVFARNKDVKFYPIVGVAATAGAKALPKPPGVLMNIS